MLFYQLLIFLAFGIFVAAFGSVIYIFFNVTNIGG